jgi:ferric-dicitrate binding protein FerR (iron transport regulator)
MNHESRSWTDVTAVNKQQTVVLPDGTNVTLAPGSSLKFRMKETREVKMDGKVYFDVARDESRPFEVDADGAFVRVLGTEFMVEESDKETVRVYVAEGKVLFARNSRTEGVILTEGMGACLGSDVSVPVVEDTGDVNSIAWQRGTFIFDQTPLKEVLDCLSAYYHVSFAATDLSKRLSGEFQTEDLDLIIELIESALDVTIIRR